MNVAQELAKKYPGRIMEVEQLLTDLDDRELREMIATLVLVVGQNSAFFTKELIRLEEAINKGGSK